MAATSHRQRVTATRPRAAIGEAAAVTDQHLAIGHQMVAERHRLARLEVGEAGHDAGGMFFGAVE